jgi:hypothetical protein
MQLRKPLTTLDGWWADCEFCGCEQVIGMGGQVADICCDSCGHSRNDPPIPFPLDLSSMELLAAIDRSGLEVFMCEDGRPAVRARN